MVHVWLGFVTSFDLLRSFSVRECANGMGFPLSLVIHAEALTSAYRIVGNAVPPPMVPPHSVTPPRHSFWQNVSLPAFAPPHSFTGIFGTASPSRRLTPTLTH